MKKRCETCGQRLPHVPMSWPERVVFTARGMSRDEVYESVRDTLQTLDPGIPVMSHGIASMEFRRVDDEWEAEVIYHEPRP